MEDEDAPSWAEHADELEYDQLALAMMRGYLSDDEADLNAVIERMYELIDKTTQDPEFGGLAMFEAALVKFALMFGRELFGDQLDEQLAGMQRDLAAHIAGYEEPER